jgi:hypothetical protein
LGKEEITAPMRQQNYCLAAWLPGEWLRLVPREVRLILHDARYVRAFNLAARGFSEEQVTSTRTFGDAQRSRFRRGAMAAMGLTGHHAW